MTIDLQIMINEVQNAAEFLSNLLRSHGTDVKVIGQFQDNLANVLCSHYNDHWFPEKPLKGSGYRCIRIVNNKMDPLISAAGSLCGLSVSQLIGLLPRELTMWIDPADVSYRIGEEGSIGQLFAGPAPVVVQQQPQQKTQQTADCDSFSSSSGSDSELEVSNSGFEQPSTLEYINYGPPQHNGFMYPTGRGLSPHNTIQYYDLAQTVSG